MLAMKISVSANQSLAESVHDVQPIDSIIPRHVTMKRVLIAEDDALIAELLEEVIADGGYAVCGVAATSDEALRFAELCNPDLAVVDVQLARGGDGIEVAARLAERRQQIGILFATGNCESVIMRKPPGHACLGKPFMPATLLAALGLVERLVNGSVPSRPLPPGLRLI
jgi:two-component system, response regulator PdtaR